MNRSISKIILAAINAKYIHTSLGSRYLLANLESFADRAQIMEFTIQERSTDIAEQILLQQPDVIIFSCYIWNVALTEEVVRHLKAVAPTVTVILGGPEVSYPTDFPEVTQLADHVICGEGEKALPGLLGEITRGNDVAHTIAAPPVNLNDIELPYHLYSAADIAHRMIYVESSRGCAFGCEFCLSSRDIKVRHFNMTRFLAALESLWQRGARQFKFIDRTIHYSKAAPILEFFLERICPNLFLHFEVVPDQLSPQLLAALKQFPPGTVQLEAGVQTFNPDVSARIGRKQNMDKTEQNIRRIVEDTGIHIHSDLVIGLPGETEESFASGFDRLLATGVHEIQVGILKRLRGAPIDRHTAANGMVYRHTAPYDILQNNLIPFMKMQELKRFSRYFDLVVNNGNFKQTAPLIWLGDSPFWSFSTFSKWLFQQSERTAGIALDKLATYLFEYLTTQKGIEKSECANRIQHDFLSNGRRRLPKCAREFATHTQTDYSDAANDNSAPGLPERQRRHTQNQ